MTDMTQYHDILERFEKLICDDRFRTFIDGPACKKLTAFIVTVLDEQKAAILKAAEKSVKEKDVAGNCDCKSGEGCLSCFKELGFNEGRAAVIAAVKEVGEV